MKKQLLILSLLFFLITISCKENENNKVEINNKEVSEKRFENTVFSFTYPEDWNITDGEAIEEGIFYLSVEKKGLDASGLITIVSYEELIDLDESILMNIEQLQDNPVLNDFSFDEIVDSQYNTVSSRSSQFNFKTMGMKHEGMIYAFSSPTNSVVILKQEAVEDRKENAEGFDTIKNSFKIK
ncbi:hypothetical protein ACFO3O_00370 [Dokdonia ponticola]|uniref:PsbP C-terminal domain-containing protein n=1 Tax=Dokdonia ponticola TaxID=2041041 RepID=A0ABV9HQA3_9FLAO